MRDPRNAVIAQPDVVQRMMLERLTRGPIAKISRITKGGPFCPMLILWLHTQHEPDEPGNDMAGTRSRHVAAFVSGQYEKPERAYFAWCVGSRLITRAEYDAAVREIQANVAAGRYDPRAEPHKPVRIESLALPFQEEANARRQASTSSASIRRAVNPTPPYRK